MKECVVIIRAVDNIVEEVPVEVQPETDLEELAKSLINASSVKRITPDGLMGKYSLYVINEENDNLPLNYNASVLATLGKQFTAICGDAVAVRLDPEGKTKTTRIKDTPEIKRLIRAAEIRLNNMRKQNNEKSRWHKLFV